MGPGGSTWDSHEASWLAQLKLALANADSNPNFGGFKESGLRNRLDMLPIKIGLSPGFDDIFHNRLVHGGLTLDKFLYDPESNLITCLKDFRSASLTHPLQEFIRFLDGRFMHRSLMEGSQLDDVPPSLMVRDIAEPPPPPPVREFDWETVQMWNEALDEVKVERPTATTPGFERALHLCQLVSALTPWNLRGELSGKQKRKRDQRFKEVEKTIEELLTRLGC